MDYAEATLVLLAHDLGELRVATIDLGDILRPAVPANARIVPEGNQVGPAGELPKETG